MEKLLRENYKPRRSQSLWIARSALYRYRMVYTIFKTQEYRIGSLRGDLDFVGDNEAISR
jgi:hypothetical protein